MEYFVDGETGAAVIAHWNTFVDEVNGLGVTTTNLGISVASLSADVAEVRLGWFAEIYVADASTAQSILATSSYTKLTCFTNNGSYNELSADAANDKIVVSQPGYYLVNGSFNFTSDTDNLLLKGSAFLGGVRQDNLYFCRKAATGANAESVSFTGIVDVTTSSDLDVRVSHSGVSAVSLTVLYANLNVHFIGET